MLSDIFNAIATISHWCKLNNQIENAEGGASLQLVSTFFVQCIDSNAVHWFTDHHHHHRMLCSRFVYVSFSRLYFDASFGSVPTISSVASASPIAMCCLRHREFTRQDIEPTLSEQTNKMKSKKCDNRRTIRMR